MSVATRDMGDTRLEWDGQAGRLQAVLLAGPTASGKSALAIAIAEAIDGIVVNADSMQVYRDLSIITARPSSDDLGRREHRLYGHVDGATVYSVGRWYDDAAATLAALGEAGKIPVIVGGTGLYFKALERGLAQMPSVPSSIREAVRSEALTQTSEALHRSLTTLDPRTAGQLRPSDRQRILRALEVIQATDVPLAEWQTRPHSPPLVDAARCLRLFLSPDRERLYDTIDHRFDLMIGRGALDEVAALARRNLDPGLPVMRAHGVPWLIRHLHGEMNAGAAIEQAKADTRHYAKRQYTWFRHQMPGWTAVSPDHPREDILAVACAAAHG